MFAPLLVPDGGSEKFAVTRGVPSTPREVGRREGLGGGTGWKYFGLVAGDQVAEDIADGRRFTGQVRESREGQATGPENDGVNGLGEEGGTERITLLYASSAVGGTVAGDERGGRLVAEVDPWSDLREGVTDSVQDGRAVYAVESILDVNEHHDFVCVAAVPVHPLACCVYDAFRCMRSSDEQSSK